MPIISEDKYYVVLVEIIVEPQYQKTFIQEMAQYIEKHIKALPGFISSSLHASQDKNKVFNYAQWKSKEAYESFLSFNPEKSERTFEQYVKSHKVTHPLRVTNVVES